MDAVAATGDAGFFPARSQIQPRNVIIAGSIHTAFIPFYVVFVINGIAGNHSKRFPTGPFLKNRGKAQYDKVIRHRPAFGTNYKDGVAHTTIKHADAFQRFHIYAEVNGAGTGHFPGGCFVIKIHPVQGGVHGIVHQIVRIHKRPVTDIVFPTTGIVVLNKEFVILGITNGYTVLGHIQHTRPKCIGACRGFVGEN